MRAAHSETSTDGSVKTRTWQTQRAQLESIVLTRRSWYPRPPTIMNITFCDARSSSAHCGSACSSAYSSAPSGSAPCALASGAAVAPPPAAASGTADAGPAPSSADGADGAGPPPPPRRLHALACTPSCSCQCQSLRWYETPRTKTTAMTIPPSSAAISGVEPSDRRRRHGGAAGGAE